MHSVENHRTHAAQLAGGLVDCDVSTVGWGEERTPTYRALCS